MHLYYKIMLPDHDFIVASGHKLIPSVYAACVISSKREVTYSGPTFITLRSGKHDSSTATTHHRDFFSLLSLTEFENVAKVDGMCKPIVIMSVDGGPDENPRYPKIMAAGVKLFLKNNLDCLFVATNSPGRSAFNPVERRMAPLSNQLAGLILPHEHYGSHLDDSEKTIDEVLEMENFQKAGECLCAVWNELMIDGHPVVCRYIEPPDSDEQSEDDADVDEDDLDLVWLAAHVRQSQYLLQIVRCHNVTCCRQWRTTYPFIFKRRFLPPPVPFKRNNQGVCVAELNDQTGHYPSLFELLQFENLIPNLDQAERAYDWMCPSIQDEFNKRTCPECKLYHPSGAAMKRHKKTHTKRYQQQQQEQQCHKKNAVVVDHLEESYSDEDLQEEIDEEHMSTPMETVDDSISAPMIKNILEFLTSDFVDDI